MADEIWLKGMNKNSVIRDERNSEEQKYFYELTNICAGTRGKTEMTQDSNN